MTKEELKKLSEQELQWLRYYADRKCRENIKTSENFYDNMKRMGYSKRQMDLYTRCAAAMVTSSYDINEKLDVSEIQIVPRARNIDNNIYTALEVYFKLYPNDEKEMLNKLK